MRFTVIGQTITVRSANYNRGQKNRTLKQKLLKITPSPPSLLQYLFESLWKTFWIGVFAVNILWKGPKGNFKHPYENYFS